MRTSDKESDKMVYKLYGLKEQEVEIIEEGETEDKMFLLLHRSGQEHYLVGVKLNLRFNKNE